MRTTAILLTMLCAFGLVLAGPAQAAQAEPRLKVDDDKFVLENDLVTIWFQGKKPMLKVLPTANATLAPDNETVAGAFGYRFTDVVEYRDLDANGIPSPTEIVARLDLAGASGWKVEQAELDGAVVLNLSLADTVKLGGKGVLPEGVAIPTDRAAEISLVFTLRGETAAIQASTQNVSIPATSVKYDFVVAKWPFVDATNDRLALVMEASGAIERANLTGVESASVATNGTAVGALTWTTTAQGRTSAGQDVEVPVKAGVAPIEGNASATLVAFTYDLPALESLVHDPTVGILRSAAAVLDPAGADALVDINKVPAPGVLVGVATVGAAALVLRHKA